MNKSLLWPFRSQLPPIIQPLHPGRAWTHRQWCHAVTRWYWLHEWRWCEECTHKHVLHTYCGGLDQNKIPWCWTEQTRSVLRFWTGPDSLAGLSVRTTLSHTLCEAGYIFIMDMLWLPWCISVCVTAASNIQVSSKAALNAAVYTCFLLGHTCIFLLNSVNALQQTSIKRVVVEVT